jgi:flagellar basal-body rod protein FlgC
MGAGTSSKASAGGVQVAQIATDQTAGKMVYDPGNPDANAQGYVQMPNVDTVTEMVDLIDAQRAYEANVTAMQASKQMFAKTLEILR